MKLTTLSECSLCFFVLVLLFASSITGVQIGEVDDEREFSYDENSDSGPAHWGDIHAEWKDCNAGEMQSPIDMMNERVKIVSHLGRLKKTYKPENATLVNRGHDMMLRWTGDGAGYITIKGIKYNLMQCHWHSPSEHTINGRRFAMEMHLVHISNDNRIAVIGIMYIIGRPDRFLTMLRQNLEAVANTSNIETTIGFVNPKRIQFGSRKYYRYIGSLTVPPCTQNITWTILRKVRTVTREQVRLIREAVHDESEVNARPIQASNDRLMEMYRPERLLEQKYN